METLTAKTPQELDALKANWRQDPIWDIETTEGFEAHYDELLAYRKEQEAKWEAEHEARNRLRADALGCPAFPEVGAAFEAAEQRALYHSERAHDAADMDALQLARHMGCQDALQAVAPVLQRLQEQIDTLDRIVS